MTQQRLQQELVLLEENDDDIFSEGEQRCQLHKLIDDVLLVAGDSVLSFYLLRVRA